jgi:predicted nucleic acid-binding protein
VFNQVIEGRTDVLVSDLAVTEVVSALARRVRAGELTPDLARRVRHEILGRLDQGRYVRVELTRDVHRRAERFLLDLIATPLRAADALHLALAASGRAASLASFDTRLAAAARAIGLATYPG